MGRASRWLRGLLGGKRAAPPPDDDDSHPLPSSKEKQQKRGFVKSFREKEPPRAAAAAPRSYRAPARRFEAVDDKEQSKRAIAVAVATAAVAEAAVAAAQAAAAVVRLTSGGRGRREWAAVKIQSLFRGYLARRALRALKGLVKLQALVRGNIVRKQAAETLRCMQALVRVQARARSCRAIRSASSSQPHPQKPDPPIRPVSKSLKRNPSNRATNTTHSSSDAVDSNTAQSSGWNWLDRWMEERYWDTREPARKASINSAMEDERNAKILEIDTGGNKRLQSSSTLTSDHNSLSSVDMRRPMTGDSPQFLSATSSRPRRGPFTPAKSECSRSVFSGYSDYPNYMSNTQSSKAKVRSQSAPKQRPEMEKAGAAKRPPSPAALRAKFADKAYPGSGRLDRLGIPLAH